MHIKKEFAIFAIVSLAVVSGCRTRQRNNIVKLEPATAVKVRTVKYSAESPKLAVKSKAEKVEMLEGKPVPRGGIKGSFTDVELEKIEETGFKYTADAIRMALAEGIDIGSVEQLNTISTISGSVLPEVDKILSVSIAQGVSIQSVSDVFCMTSEDGIPIETVASFFILATISRIQIYKVVSLFELAEKYSVLAKMVPILKMSTEKNITYIIETFELAEQKSIKFSEIIPIFSLVYTKRVDVNIVINTLRFAILTGIPLKDVETIAEFSQRTRISVETISVVYVEIMKYTTISPDLVVSLLPLSEGVSVKTVDVHIESLTRKKGVSKAVLRIAAMKTILAIISNCKPALSLSLIPDMKQYRWELVTPEEYSLLFEIKCQAEVMESRGQNTDELWHRFWEVYLNEPDEEEAETKQSP